MTNTCGRRIHLTWEKSTETSAWDYHFLCRLVAQQWIQQKVKQRETRCFLELAVWERLASAPPSGGHLLLALKSEVQSLNTPLTPNKAHPIPNTPLQLALPSSNSHVLLWGWGSRSRGWADPAVGCWPAPPRPFSLHLKQLWMESIRKGFPF